MTIRSYEILGTYSAFVRNRCALRHALVRFCIPLIYCIATDLLLFGLPDSPDPD